MTNPQKPEISIVIPLYNEEQVFDSLISRLDAVLNNFNYATEIVLIDDGSRDNTAELMKAKCLSDARYTGLFLSRNHGHQLALSAGLAHAQGSEAIMVLDGDLQDPPELINEFYNLYKI